MLALMFGSCKKDYLETNPTDAVSNGTIFKTTDGAYTALNGMYRSMYAAEGSQMFGQKSIDLALDMMGNDMVRNTTGSGWFLGDYDYTDATSTRSSVDYRPYGVWNYYYTQINNANLILKYIDAASGSEKDKNNLKGQALAMRAYSYFYLINMFQHGYKGNESKPGVPLYTEPTKEGKPRGTVQDVYTQINKDLDDAEKFLEGVSRIHFSHIDKRTVQGMHARVALQQGNYQGAASFAAKARAGLKLMSQMEYTQGFSKPNEEWIWGMIVQNDQSGKFASFWSHMDPYAKGYASLGAQQKITKDLYNKIDTNDIRSKVFVMLPPIDPNLKDEEKKKEQAKRALTPNYTSIKFVKPVPSSWDSNDLLMRASEMMLIEAEALARTGKDADALKLLTDLIKARNPKYVFTAGGDQLVNEILLQRRIELWGEGFSLLDIKRLKQGLNRPVGEGNHSVSLARKITLPAEDNAFLLKIPLVEFDANKSLSPADQNP